ncbi:heavy metal transport protein [Bordetella pertussis]|uniref:heavy-metal-associated domain-containing protein n=1 Tax=Bordetella pertussis TaxID=520 RepID=UPI0005DAB25F|nr:heavy-metal-associated domain-containing protein [Bordetella pertussis]CFO54244.1 heavy metal transport protein [Bordetella pertussis]
MTIAFHVPDMTCGHCVKSITQAVQQAVPQALVQIDLAARRVTVEGVAAAEPVAQAIRAAGYAVQAA